MEFIFLLIQGVSVLILVDVVASWVVQPGSFPRNLTSQLTEPMYRPFRSLLPPEKMGGLDLSPMAVLIGLTVLRQALYGALAGGGPL
ncbi:MAG: YggT family protein [Myxococcota bacterium]